MSLNNLKGEFIRKRIKQKDVADYLGMTASNFNKKLSETIPFTVEEIKKVRARYLPQLELDYLLESDGDVPTGRERLHHYAEAIGDALTKDGEEPDPEVDEIVELFHDCANAAQLNEDN